MNGKKATGKKVALAGLVLGAASLMPMHAQQVALDTLKTATHQSSVRVFDAAPDDTTAVVVRGKVLVVEKDDNYEAIGASVILKGTKLRTFTDLDGNFAIRVPKDSQLVIECLGCATTCEYEVKESTADEFVIIAIERDEKLSDSKVIVR